MTTTTTPHAKAQKNTLASILPMMELFDTTAELDQAIAESRQRLHRTYQLTPDQQEQMLEALKVYRDRSE